MAQSGMMRFYKSTGAAQFSLLPVRYTEEGYVDKDGAVLCEVAPGNGDRNNPQWDWSKKISFAISFADVANLLDTVNPKAGRIFHKHGDTPKTLEFKPGGPGWEGTYQLQLAQGKGESRSTVTVPLSNGEFGAIMRVLVAALPKLIAWE